jgi:hypothetical protein
VGSWVRLSPPWCQYVLTHCSCTTTHIFSSVLHPVIYISYFEDPTCWSEDIPKWAHILLEHLHNVYSEPEDCTSLLFTTPHTPDPAQSSIFTQDIKIPRTHSNAVEHLRSTAISMAGIRAGTRMCWGGIRWIYITLKLLQSNVQALEP